MNQSTSDQRKLAHLARFKRGDRPGPLNPASVIETANASRHVAVRTETVSWDAFDDYLKRTNYPERFPAYVKEFGTGSVFFGKALEHHLSFKYLDPKGGDVVMDVAASNSPCSELLLKDLGVATAYRQDLNLPAGVNENRVGSPASAIPLPDGSLDSMMLHNSWEHFEGDEDIAFLFETRRLLKPGGRMLIIPLFLKDEMEIWTSPTVWSGKYSAVSQTPSFDPRATIVVREDVRQRQAKFFDATSLLADLAQVPDLEFELIYFPNSWERDYGFPFALLSRRTA